MKKTCCLFIFITCILFTSCTVFRKNSFNPNAKYSPQQLQEDFLVLNKVLKANHPSLYWYANADSVNNSFAAVFYSLHDSLTQQQFRKKISWAVSKINCGHTLVRASKEYLKYYSKHKTTLFPLYLKVWNDSAIVINNLSVDDSIVKRGTAIISINRVGVKDIIDSICRLISSDGYSKIFKYQVISFNFPGFYQYAYGTDSAYTVRYIDSTGLTKEKVYKNLKANPGIFTAKQQLLPGEITKRKLRQINLQSYRSLEIDSTSKTAILSVNTFSKGKLILFFRKSFKKIKNENINNVVLDLRLNSGGSVIACTKLSQYLADKPFRLADTVAAVNRSFHYKRYIKPWFIYWLSMHLSTRHNGDGRMHFRYFEKHYFKPKKKDYFNGNIYVLTGGYTFSAASIVAGNLKGQRNVTIVGEETGGGSYGNSAMLLTNIVLPNTALRVTLPLFRMVLNTNRAKTGRGVFPDVEVRPSSLSIKKNIDSKMVKAMELIKINSLR